MRDIVPDKTKANACNHPALLPPGWRGRVRALFRPLCVMVLLGLLMQLSCYLLVRCIDTNDGALGGMLSVAQTSDQLAVIQDGIDTGDQKLVAQRMDLLRFNVDWHARDESGSEFTGTSPAVREWIATVAELSKKAETTALTKSDAERLARTYSNALSSTVTQGLFHNLTLRNQAIFWSPFVLIALLALAFALGVIGSSNATTAAKSTNSSGDHTESFGSLTKAAY